MGDEGNVVFEGSGSSEEPVEATEAETEVTAPVEEDTAPTEGSEAPPAAYKHPVEGGVTNRQKLKAKFLAERSAE